MELIQLSRFLAVIQHRSFSEAARQLGLTQQTLSASIRQLEQSVGVPLFQRGRGQSTALTVYGERLANHARSQIALRDKALKDLRDLRDAKAGHVKVGIAETMTGEIVGRAICRVLDENPDVRIEMTEGFSEDLLNLLVRGELDFIASSPISGVPTGDNIVQEHLFTARDVVIASRDHPLANRSRLTVEDLQGFPWIVGPPGRAPEQAIRNAFAEANLPAPRFLWGKASSTSLAILGRRQYLSLVPQHMIGSQFGDGTYISLPVDKPSVERTACFSYLSDSEPSPIARRLMAEIRLSAEQIVTLS